MRSKPRKHRNKRERKRPDKIKEPRGAGLRNKSKKPKSRRHLLQKLESLELKKQDWKRREQRHFDRCPRCQKGLKDEGPLYYGCSMYTKGNRLSEWYEKDIAKIRKQLKELG